MYPRPPYTYGSNASQLIKLLLAGHHGVSLNDDEWERLVTWIDANGVYYDRYETDASDRHILTGRVREEMDSVYARRCARCHGEKHDGRHATWWLSLNRRHVRSSRALAAPLARSAGGRQRCTGIIFADPNDSDYQRLLAALIAVRGKLGEQPRADLLSVRVTAAELP